MQVSEERIRKAVKDRYADLASTNGNRACCSSSCCGESSSPSLFPAEAAQVTAGCGSPIESADIGQGMLVVDLGSGGGIDVFRASGLVGNKGKVIGVDSTPEMVWRARETSKKHGYTNVEFRLGEIENLPIESNKVDIVVSNCVINLAPDKEKVFKEAFRVLKPGGKIVVSDIVTDRPFPEELKNDMASWSSCVSGALVEKDYKTIIESSGLNNLTISERSVMNEEEDRSSNLPDLSASQFRQRSHSDI